MIYRLCERVLMISRFCERFFRISGFVGSDDSVWLGMYDFEGGAIWQV